MTRRWVKLPCNEKTIVNQGTLPAKLQGNPVIRRKARRVIAIV